LHKHLIQAVIGLNVSRLFWLNRKFQNSLRLPHDLYCVEWGVKLYSLTSKQFWNFCFSQNTTF